MKFTAQNFQTEYPKIEKREKDMNERFEKMKRFAPQYNNSASIKHAIDLFVMQLNQRYGSKTASIASKKSPPPEKTTKPKAEKVAKSKKVKPVCTATKVEKILPEVGFIKRFCTLNGKTMQEAKEPALRILNALQKAIVEKVIRKTSPYAAEIEKVQKHLITIIEYQDSNTPIKIGEKYKEIAKSQKINPETAIIKAFIAIQGKEEVMPKARALYERNKKIFSSSTKKEEKLRDIQISLKQYIEGKTKTIEVENQTLQGLYGLAGIDFKPKTGEVVSSTEFLGSKFDTLKFTGKWKKLIGNPDKNFRLMMYGKPGSGKSTLSLFFAGYLSGKLGKHVLYVAGEEKFGYTLQEKIVRLDVANVNLVISDKIPANLDRFDVVFIDSVNTLGLEPDQLKKLPKCCAYIFVFQTTKEGHFRGSQEFSHDVDTVIKVENMKAKTEKNRFGGEVKEISVM